MTNKKALVGVSGGVDSSVAAYLMLRSGYTCIGATMRLYNNEDITIFLPKELRNIESFYDFTKIDGESEDEESE